MELAGPLRTVGLVCWCPEGLCGDVPVMQGASPPSQDRWEGVSSSLTQWPSRRVTLQGIEQPGALCLGTICQASINAAQLSQARRWALSRATAARRQMEGPPEPIPNTPVPILLLSTCSGDISLREATVHAMLPGTRSMNGAVGMDDGEAAGSSEGGGCSGGFGKGPAGQREDELGEMRKLENATLWNGPWHPEIALFGSHDALVPRCHRCRLCQRTGPGFNAHAHLSPGQSILQREASFFDLNMSYSGKLTAVPCGVFQWLPA